MNRLGRRLQVDIAGTEAVNNDMPGPPWSFKKAKVGSLCNNMYYTVSFVDSVHQVNVFGCYGEDRRKTNATCYC